MRSYGILDVGVSKTSGGPLKINSSAARVAEIQ
jgi:hypothetical protein